MSEPAIMLADAPTMATRQAILAPLLRFNEDRTGQATDYRPLAVLVSDPDSGAVIGGLWGNTALSYLHIELLFVPAELRSRGLGRRLLGDAEAEARRRGCHSAWLDTHSFQARGFYERLDYRAFGTLDDYPPGHSRIFLTKRLDGAPSSSAR